MSRARWLTAAALLIALLGLMLWQNHRERLMQACLAEGRTWNGPATRCDPPRMGPILRRALERS